MYRLSPLAQTELEEIADRIAEDSPGDARRFIERLTKKSERLGRRPMIGRARPELRPDLRSLPYGSFLILYRIIDDGVEIVRVIRAARYLEDLV